MKKLLVALFAVMAQATVWAIAVPTTPNIQVLTGDGSVSVVMIGDGSVRVLPGDGSVVPGDGSVRVVNDGDIETWTVPSFSIGDSTFANLVFSFDPDPFIAFAAAVNKSSSVSTTYSILFGSPYVGGPYDRVSSQLDATLLAPTPGSAQMTGITHKTNVDGVDELTTTMPNCSSNGSLATCTTTAGGPLSIGPTGNSGVFSSAFSFTLDAPSTATFTGRSDLFASTPVPAPATLPLALLALAGLGWTMRRRAAARD